MKFLFVLATILLFVSNSFGQIDKQADRVWIQGNFIIPVNDFDSDPGLEFSYIARILYRHSYNNDFALEIGAGFGKYAGLDDSVWPRNYYYGTTIIPVDGRLLYTPFDFETIRPYVYAGLGFMYYDVTQPHKQVSPGAVDQSGVTLHIPLGLGMEYYISEGFAIDLSVGGALSLTENLNYYNNEDMTDGYLKFGLGVTFSLPEGDPDADKDGLTIDVENQIGTNPMLSDTDGDGINDGDEVNVYKTNPLKGDTDGDGLNDYDEIKNHKTDAGKADSDGDGLNDYDEIKTYKTDALNKDTDGDTLSDFDELKTYKTNPSVKDTDKDGLDDNVEIATYKTDPNKADTDGDTLSDSDEINKYKTNPLSKDSDNGSVADNTEISRGTDPNNADDDVIKKDVAIVLEGITFGTGSDDINPESEAKLNEALKTLKTYNDIVVEISGHTDNVGSSSSNTKLSQKRAESVKAWFISKGIDASRLEAKGYGEDKPIADNSTKDGKAKNRRIEFKRIK